MKALRGAIGALDGQIAVLVAVAEGLDLQVARLEKGLEAAEKRIEKLAELWAGRAPAPRAAKPKRKAAAKAPARSAKAKKAGRGR